LPRELSGSFIPERKPWRTLVQVEGREQESATITIKMIVPRQDPHTPIRFPMSRVLLAIRCGWPTTPAPAWYPAGLVQVNIGAKDPKDLYLHCLEPAPPSNPEDGLG